MKALVDLKLILHKTEFIIFKDVEAYPGTSMNGRCIRLGLSLNSVFKALQNLLKKNLVTKNEAGKYKSVVKYTTKGETRNVVDLAASYSRKWDWIKIAIAKRMHCFTVYEVMKIRQFEDTQKLMNKL